MTAPRLECRFASSGRFRVDVTYRSGQTTRYPSVPMWWYGLAWIRAYRKRGGVGHVVALLKASAGVLKPETIHPGRSMAGEASRNHQQTLISHPGDLTGWAESLK